MEEKKIDTPTPPPPLLEYVCADSHKADVLPSPAHYESSVAGSLVVGAAKGTSGAESCTRATEAGCTSDLGAAGVGGGSTSTTTATGGTETVGASTCLQTAGAVTGWATARFDSTLTAAESAATALWCDASATARSAATSRGKAGGGSEGRRCGAARVRRFAAGA